MSTERLVIDPEEARNCRIFISEQTIPFLNEGLAHPGRRYTDWIVHFFDKDLSPREAADLTIDEAKLEARRRVAEGLAFVFSSQIKQYFPDCENPFSYSEEQARKICRFCASLPRDCPLDSVMSVKRFSEYVGVLPKDLSDLENRRFVYGNLVLEYIINGGNTWPLNNSCVKKAIRESVHTHDGRARLSTRSIKGNMERIRSQRRQIGIEPFFVANP